VNTHKHLINQKTKMLGKRNRPDDDYEYTGGRPRDPKFDPRFISAFQSMSTVGPYQDFERAIRDTEKQWKESSFGGTPQPRYDNVTGHLDMLKKRHTISKGQAQNTPATYLEKRKPGLVESAWSRNAILGRASEILLGTNKDLDTADEYQAMLDLRESPVYINVLQRRDHILPEYSEFEKRESEVDMGRAGQLFNGGSDDFDVLDRRYGMRVNPSYILEADRVDSLLRMPGTGQLLNKQNPLDAAAYLEHQTQMADMTGSFDIGAVKSGYTPYRAFMAGQLVGKYQVLNANRKI
jgi:hypothetical protein